LRVIGTGLVVIRRSAQRKGGAELGDKLFHRIGVIAEAFSKLPIAAGLGRSPVSVMPISA
jgi:hypothetical protein